MVTDWRLPENRREAFHASSYLEAHDRLAERFGGASSYLCVCGKQAEHWAYQHSGTPVVDEKERVYSLDPGDYAPMCRSCHFKMDNELSPKRAEAHRRSMVAWRTPEAMEKIRQKLTGRKRPPETVAKIRAAWTPERRAEHAEKVREALKGKKR